MALFEPWIFSAEVSRSETGARYPCPRWGKIASISLTKT